MSDGKPVLRIRRKCQIHSGYHGPHGWEPVNEHEKPFRRGRVVYFCAGGRGA